MAKNIEIKCNFDSVFKQFNTVEELKNAATNIVEQVKKSYEERALQLKKQATAEVKAAVTSQEKGKKQASAHAKDSERIDGKPVPKAASPAKTTAKPKSDEVLISITDTEAISKLNLKFEKYSERSWALYGDTKPIRHGLKELGGAYNRFLKGGEGWVFRNENAVECARALGLAMA